MPTVYLRAKRATTKNYLNMASLETRRDFLITQLQSRRLMLGTAESCTGGLMSKLLTDVPGSSEWFDSALVTYSNSAKHRLLQIDKGKIERNGAVSQPVVEAMAESVVKLTDADVAISTSGIAGPGGGSAEKPVGMVWTGFAGRDWPTECHCFLFKGEREAIRLQAAEKAFQLMSQFIVKNA